METKEFQRWTARRKVELFLQLIRGGKSCFAGRTAPQGHGEAHPGDRLMSMHFWSPEQSASEVHDLLSVL